MQRQLPKAKLTYTDSTHAYYLNGRRASGVSSLAKIPVDHYTIDAWDRRQILIGAALDRNIVENVAMDIENRDLINEQVSQAKYIAGQHRKADRGSQKHRVLELILTGREGALLTDQQRADAEVLKRTLDLYKLTPHDGLVEQFVCYPDYKVAGRFDCIMERNDGSLVLVDLKSGEGAVKYPQSTSIQLALYGRAPMCSVTINQRGKDKVSIDEWRELPERLDRTRAYVLLVEQDAKVGSFHRIDIEHGWTAAQYALNIIAWRRQLDYGNQIALEIKPDDPVIVNESRVDGYTDLVERAGSVKELQMYWRNARSEGALTLSLDEAMRMRAKFLKEQA